MKSKTRSQSSARSPGIKATDKAPKVENSPEPSSKPKEVRVFGPASVPRDELANKSPEEKRSAYDGDTAFKLYLREIGQVKLLTPQEEIELAARIKKGDKKAREQMIKANLRLVVKIAHDYEGFGLPCSI